ncbi:hypothetical protein [Sphingobacterium spiritivorum]|uniref:hypothetical protein n=1 Tax=Sphingobacterium spiritivorum TaxID=258 RepID=UPI00191A835F|nr:hypothetical protein [Sphingobacterium spiritivorum]QQT25767.1 hypothetical protein I6J02_18950 [Sphingobacterium spiritivorum]
MLIGNVDTSATLAPAGEFEAKGLLTFDDLEKLIEQDMAFEKLNIKFDYWK